MKGMKKFNIFCIIAAGCLFAGCASSNEENQENGNGSLSLNVAPGATTRVTETEDADNVVKTTWESTDKLDVWHKYTISGNATFCNLEFSNTSTPGTTGTSTFKYTEAYTGDEYYYTNGEPVLAFNKLGTNSTRTANSDNVVLALTNYGSQTGTLASIKSFDAMCGSAAVSNNKPADISMNHLGSIICFHLSGLAASTSYSVTFGCSAAAKSILPNTASFTLNTSGTVTENTLTGATSWTVNTTSDASGSALVYLMTFPFSNISGILTVQATGGSKVYSKSIFLNNFSLASGTAKKQKCTLATSNTGMPLTTGSRGDNYVWNSAYYLNGNGVSIANCPSYDEYKQIWANGWIWDPGTSAAADPAIYAVTGGARGLWLSTYCKIPNVTVPSTFTDNNVVPVLLSTWKAAATSTNTGTWLATHCFFLPYVIPSRYSPANYTNEAPVHQGQYYFVNHFTLDGSHYAYLNNINFDSGYLNANTYGFVPGNQLVPVPYFTVSR